MQLEHHRWKHFGQIFVNTLLRFVRKRRRQKRKKNWTSFSETCFVYNNNTRRLKMTKWHKHAFWKSVRNTLAGLIQCLIELKHKFHNAISLRLIWVSLNFFIALKTLVGLANGFKFQFDSFLSNLHSNILLYSFCNQIMTNFVEM